MALTKDTIIKYQSGSSYVAFVGVTSVSTPDHSVTDVESTDLVSDAKEYEPGIGDGGKVSFTIKYTDASFTLVTGMRGTVTSFQVLFSDNNGFQFAGYINKVMAKADGPDKLLVLECEIKVSGDTTVLTP